MCCSIVKFIGFVALVGLDLWTSGPPIIAAFVLRKLQVCARNLLRLLFWMGVGKESISAQLACLVVIYGLAYGIYLGFRG